MRGFTLKLNILFFNSPKNKILIEMIIVDEQACSIIQMTSISRQEKKVITYNMSSV